jgi:subtilisin family serine protease
MPEEGSPEDYPNNYGQGIVNVGATTNNDQRSWYSYAKPYIDVSAPGGNADGVDERDIFSTVPNNGFDYMAGTSMAAPHATGVASLLKGYASTNLGINLYNDDLEQILRISADDIYDTLDGTTGPGWDQGTGTGRINVRKALDLLRPPNYFAQWSASGYTSVMEDCIWWPECPPFFVTFYSVPGLPDGMYSVHRYKVDRL